MWLFKKVIVKDEAREKELQDDLNASQQESLKLVERITELQEKLQSFAEATGKIVKERNELKKMVREQTEADLLINAMKAVGIIKSKGLEHEEFSNRDRRLREMQARAAQMNTQLPGVIGGWLGSRHLI